MNRNIINQSEEIKVLLKSIIKSYKCVINEHIKDYGFTVPQIHLLQVLYNHPDITLKELSGHLGQAKSTVSGIVDRLECQGTVVRTRSTDDRRTVRISLSQKSSEFRDSLNIIKNNYLADILNEVTSEDVEQIISSLRLLNSLMEKKNRSDADV